MNSKRIATIVILSVIGLIVAVFVVRFATIGRRTVAKSIEEIQEEEGVPVDVHVVSRGTISSYLEILGTVQGIEQVQMTSSLPLDVAEITKSEGDAVKKGDVVIRLARGRRGRAYHQYATAEQALENAENDLKRTENLFREGAVSGQTLEQARLAYKNAKAQLDQAASVVDLVSPIDGIVTMVGATVGEEALPGAPLATVASIDRLRLRCYVGYDEAGRLRVGQEARVELPADGRGARADSATSETWGRSDVEGEVSRVSFSADPEMKLFLVEITCDNVNDGLRPGMVTSIHVLVDQKSDALTVPSDALFERDEKDYIYSVASGRARLVEVAVGTDNGDSVEITHGVAEGDTVVFRGQYRLADGARVKVHSIEGMK
jgi:RND family efflux transporter MFP subunit